ncbi:hypothetical protein EGR_03735 [Echinococcus granulosus]|uniref:Uncharacterized protein n=1 Tax=Echinococcus granulosus TaxID=6210 RepID=W6UJ10_ECHGR|nr:hypothetical protein EGR_03735 [Echinococcus granulosus]EUB61445.1 hypothetical protein EGR_03735 [Echinococcus granulosus]
MHKIAHSNRSSGIVIESHNEATNGMAECRISDEGIRNPVGSIRLNRRSEELEGRNKSVEIAMISDDKDINEEAVRQILNEGIYCPLSEVTVLEGSTSVPSTRNSARHLNSFKVSTGNEMVNNNVEGFEESECILSLNCIIERNEDSINRISEGNSNCPKTEVDVPCTPSTRNTVISMVSSNLEANSETGRTMSEEGVKCASTKGVTSLRSLKVSTVRNSTFEMNDFSGLVDIDMMIDISDDDKEADYKLAKVETEKLFRNSSVNSSVESNNFSEVVNIVPVKIIQKDGDKARGSQSSHRLKLTRIEPGALTTLSAAMSKT